MQQMTAESDDALSAQSSSSSSLSSSEEVPRPTSPLSPPLPLPQAAVRKKIVLIRHAMTTENEKMAAMMEGFHQIGRLHAPSMTQVSASFSLLRGNLDSNLSGQGQRQLLDMAMILKDAHFVESFAPELVVVSSLTRARLTCDALFNNNNNNNNKTEVVVTDMLREATPFEHVFSSTLFDRISRFNEWLSSREETRIVIVGHAQYFNKMLSNNAVDAAHFYMQNVDVWETCYAREVGEWRWGVGDELKLLHRSSLSFAHPWTNDATDDEGQAGEGIVGGGGSNTDGEGK